MVGIDDGVLWFDRVRSRPLMRSSRAQVPRTWRSVSVAPDSRVVVGIDPEGEAQVRYGGYYTSAPFGFPSAGFTVGRGPWAAVAAGPVSPVNIFVGVRRDGSTAFGACQPSEWGPVGDLAKPTDDPVTAFTVGHEPLLGHGSGAVTSRVELWREDGTILKLIELRGLIVVLVAMKGDGENCVVRVRGHDGRRVVERHFGLVKSLDAMAIRDDLWIAVSGGDPDSFTTLRLAIKDEPGGSPSQFETGYEQVGVDATSVALNDRQGRPIVGMLVGRLLQVVDALDGSPIGVAPLDPERWVLVEVPGGAQFLAGDAVLRVAEPSDVAAVRPDPLDSAHMRPADVRADRLWRRLDTPKDESPRPPSGAQMPAEPDDIAGPPDDLRFRDVVLDFVPYSELPYAMLLNKAELGDGAAEAELNRRARAAVERDIRALHDEDGAPEL
jgi:hypothetical protein